MVSAKRDNFFLLQKRHSSSGSRDKFGLKIIKNWADNLSIGDIGKLSHDLYGKLERLNRQDIPPLERFEILGVLQTPLYFALDTLLQSCSEGDIPLSTKARLAADMRLELMVQSVIGYKIVLSQFHDDSIAGFLLHRHARSEALHSALFYLGEILLHTYIVFQPCLSHVWKELHGIYYYSVTNELHITKSVKTAGGASEKSDIEGLYKQILLLAMANPNSLLRGEVEKVNAALVQWAATVELVPIREPVCAKSFFLIDAQSDAMPCAPNLCSKEKIDIGWTLITDDLDRLLEQKLTAMDVSGKKMRPADAVSRRLMHKLRAAWTQQIRTREVRRHTSGMVEVVWGLEPLYTLHGGRQLAGTIGQRWRSKPFLTSPGYAEVDSGMLNCHEVMIEIDPAILEGQGVMGADVLDLREARVQRKECVSTNKSENGYYLNWSENGDSGTHVGELVGVNPVGYKQTGVDITLGVIRWMHLERPGFLGLGVELLSGLVEPIILQRIRKGAVETESIKGFLQHEGQGCVSLITMPFYVDEEDLFRVVTNGQRQQVELRQVIESTDSFVRFQFEQAASAH